MSATTPHGQAGRPGGITITGSGAVEAVPDVVHVELGAEARSADVQEALDAAGAGLDAARTSLLAAGARPEDVRSSQTSTWTETPESGPARTTARLTLRVTLRDTSTAGAVVRDALAAAGGVARLESMSLAISDPAPHLRAARERAFADARATAEQLATLAGRTLGAVVEIQDGAPTGPGPRMMAMRSDAVASSLSVDPGTQEIAASVTVRWEFDSAEPQWV